jgi:hypothetical protein
MAYLKCELTIYRDRTRPAGSVSTLVNTMRWESFTNYSRHLLLRVHVYLWSTKRTLEELRQSMTQAFGVHSFALSDYQRPCHNGAFDYSEGGVRTSWR